MTVAEAALEVRRCEGTIRRWIREGQLDGEKPGADSSSTGGKWNVTVESVMRMKYGSAYNG